MKTPFFHAHTDGILEGWVEIKLTSKCFQTGHHDCRIYRDQAEAYDYLIQRAQMDIDFLKDQIKSYKKARDWKP